MIKRCIFVLPFLFLLSGILSGSANLSGAVRGLAGDGWADVVLGKPDFSGLAPNEVTASRVFNGGGVIVDRSVSPNRLYVYDGGNSRVLGLSHLGVCAAGVNQDLACTVDSDCPGSTCPIQDGLAADLVIGQPDFTHSGCNGDSNFQNYPQRAPASASTLCGMPESQVSPLEGGSMANMAVDASGGLYVPDWDNHRVLYYESPFTTGAQGRIADDVWGQADFTGNLCNEGRFEESPDQNSLCLRSKYNEGFVGGVGLDPDNNLWITDNQNNRVLRFPYDPATGRAGHTADLVLGQQSFSAYEHGSGLERMWAPAAVRINTSGSVYVADYHNNRILIFDPPLTSGMSATRLLGGTLALHRPAALEFDLEGNLWVSDRENFQLLRFNPAGVVDRVLFKDLPNYNSQCGGNYTGDVPVPFTFPGSSDTIDAWNFCDSSGSIGIDSDGNLFAFVANAWQDVYRFPAPFPPMAAGTAHSADHQLFRPYVHHEFNHVSDRAMVSPRGVLAVDGQLIVTDMGRILFWNKTPDQLANGLPADGYVGVQNFNLQAQPHFNKIDADAARHWLYAMRGSAVEVYATPLNTGDTPTQTITNPLNVLGGALTAYNWRAPALTGLQNLSLPGKQPFRAAALDTQWDDNLYTGDIALSKDGKYLWISDSENSRVLRVRDPLTHPTVDIVLGQPNITARLCNQGLAQPAANTLCYPGHLAFDNQGNLYVSDHSLEARGNRRLLEFDAADFPDQPQAVVYNLPARRVFGTNGSFNTICEGGTHGPCGPWDPAFDLLGRMFLGYNGYLGPHFPQVFENPLANPSPAGALNDYYSMAFTTYVDQSADTLYVGDLNRGRVLVYYLLPAGPGYTLSGRLLNQIGYGIPGAAVQVKNTVWQAASGADGRYAIEGVTPGDYAIIPGQASCAFDPPQRAVSVNDDLPEQNFSAVCTYTISGRIMLGAQPVAGAEVAASPSAVSATTGVDGMYVLTGVPPGLFGLTVTPPGSACANPTLQVDVTNQDVENANINCAVLTYLPLVIR